MWRLNTYVFLLIMITSFSLNAEKMYWDKSELLTTGSIGKIKTVQSENSVFIFYTDMQNYNNNSQSFTIKCLKSTDGKKFSESPIMIRGGYTNTEYGYDFDVFIHNQKAYVIYREKENKLSLYKIDIFDGSMETIYYIESESSILYLPKLTFNQNDIMYLTYYEYSSIEELHFESVNFNAVKQNSYICGKELQSVLNPEMIYNNGVLYITYQARTAVISGEQSELFYKIFLEFTIDNGATWTRYPLLSGAELNNQNQRPNFVVESNKLYMVWERDDESYLSHIAYKCFDLISQKDIFNLTISPIQSEGYNPQILRQRNLNHIFWYDNQSGSFQNYYTQAVAEQVMEIEALEKVSNRTLHHSPILYKSKPLVIWNNLNAGKNRLFLQKHDEYVAKPNLFIRGTSNITNKQSVTVYWNSVEDISGLKEYRLLMTQNKNDIIDKSRVGITPFIKERTFDNLSDGVYFVRLAAYDNAGNESKITEISFTVDTLAPFPPLFTSLEQDESGDLTTNSPVISWYGEEEEYSSYEIVNTFFNGELDMEAAKNKAKNYIERSGSIKRGRSTTNDYFEPGEMDNGVLVVGVAGYDKAGNRSDFSFKSFSFNNYIPVTYIDSVRFASYGFVDKVLHFTGRGFLIDGAVNKIIIDRDKKEPFDYVLNASNIRVNDDRSLQQRFPKEIEENNYFVGIEHPKRGIVFAPKKLSYSNEWLFTFETKDYFNFSRIRGLGSYINGTTFIITSMAIIWTMVLLLLLRGVLVTAHDKRALNLLIEKLQQAKDEANDQIQSINKEVIMKIKMSLTVKYTLLILALVIMIVGSTSTVLGIFALRNNSTNLSDEIAKRFNLTITNLRAGINDILLFNKESYEANDLARTTASLPNIGFIYSRFGSDNYVTFRSGLNDDIFYNGMDISQLKEYSAEKRDDEISKYVYDNELKKIIAMYKDMTLPETLSNRDFTTTIPSKIKDYRARLQEQLKKGVNIEKLEKNIADSDRLQSLLNMMYAYNKKQNKYIYSGTTDSQTIKEMYNFLLSIDFLFNIVYVLPELNADKLENSYLFYMPVSPLNINTGIREYAGDVIICFSFKETIDLLSTQQRNLILITLFVTLTAIALSAVGSIILASSTIRPIRKMYNHVSLISKTDDYEELVGTEHEKLTIETGDEISVLANSINDMTSKLIEKAMADKQLLLGKEIQKKFIPLEPFKNEEIDIYGFYEGAKGVSGDYFDYKKIDDDHYAFIICDVAGKAVPAALIMVQISTIFHSFTTNFKPGVDKIETTGLITEINDTVAERGFQGRFAATLVLILNIKTGKAYMTNAGYTQLLVYRKKTDLCEWLKLCDENGAAGVFPSYMLPKPYKQETMQVNHGDILFLFSDGIEESRNGESFLNENGELQYDEFGLTRIVETLDAAKEKTAEGVITHLMTTERKYRGNMEQYDDLTILAVRRI